MDLTLPLDHAAIERILLHRYPFLFVDRITEFEVDKRIVGIKNVRFRRQVCPGDVVVIEANVVRLRSRMGMLEGVARVNGKRVMDGTMTFALGLLGADAD